MARIRSVHPSLFTDEAWVSCSPLARVLYIGLMTDADDQGLFEWKPLQIRMRLLPGDNADVAALLSELVDANLIAQLESAGKKLGAIRYFRRFQRPKKPTAQFVLPPEWGTYVGLSEVSSEPDDDEPPPVPPNSEIAPQMEDGGWRMEVEDGVSVTDDTGATDWVGRLAEAKAAAFGGFDPTSTGIMHAGDLRAFCEPTAGEPCEWSEVLDAIRMAAARAKTRGKPLRSWSWIKDDVLALRDKRLTAHLPEPRHERPHHDAKFQARQDNLARAFAGAELAAGRPREP